MSKYKQGFYKLTSLAESKYVGNKNNIVYRSSWEKKILDWLSVNPRITKFSSEEIVIPYVSKIDGGIHRYFVDFYFEYIDKNNIIHKVLAEVKPYSQTIPPKKGSNLNTYISACLTYQTNMDKWQKCREFCKMKGLEFVILTEKNTNGAFL